MSRTDAPTTEGTFRVYSRDGDDLLLVDVADLEPVRVAAGAAPGPAPGAGENGDERPTVEALHPGYLVDATLAWSGGTARFEACAVRERTLFAFAAGVTGLFEDARRAWQEAERAGEAVNSRVTADTDGRPNGALYVFAKQPGERDVFAEFRAGTRPLEPLLDRVERPEPYEVFVFRPAEEPFVLVYVVFEKGSLLGDTVRDTYGCPRPEEPASDSGDSASGPGSASGSTSGPAE